jgi:L-2-hydroxyglutarate oxidase LhgO
MEGVNLASIPMLRLAKGNYFKLLGRTPFSRLIYPVPERDGLGVHLTLDLNGRARFGPDVEWVDSERYDVDPSRAEAFYAAIRAYWPALSDHSLVPDYSGIRPKLATSSGASTDFVVQGAAEHGVPGLVNLFGIESPGLTSCLAIAEFAVGRA